MSELQNKFLKDSEKIAFDKKHRDTIKFNMSRYDKAFINGKLQFKHLENAKEKAAYLKYKVINDLDKYLIEFEGNFEKNGGKVIWAQDEKEAVKEVLKIFKSANAKTLVKSKSMTTEEIELNSALEGQKIEVLETDLGEYIVQLAGEKPYHIVTPAMHKSKEEIASLYHEKFDISENSTPEEITDYTRYLLRDKFVNADIGITGANFIIADSGSIALTENEGNGMMSMAWPNIHIAIVGIEKIIPSVTDLDLFWPLLASHGTGQNVTVYNSVISGPKKDNEADGPKEMYVILLDNNRSKLLKEDRQRQALSCIRCGACLNACPVYHNIGGYTYNTTYSGPIGSVINPYLNKMDDYKHLSFASSLCGKCTEICPVKIPLHELLLVNRNDSVQQGYSNSMDKFSMYGFKKMMLKRSMMDLMGGKTKNFGMKQVFKSSWGPRRELPKIADRSFNRQWRDNKGIK